MTGSLDIEKDVGDDGGANEVGDEQEGLSGVELRRAARIGDAYVGKELAGLFQGGL